MFVLLGGGGQPGGMDAEMKGRTWVLKQLWVSWSLGCRSSGGELQREGK